MMIQQNSFGALCTTKKRAILMVIWAPVSIKRPNLEFLQNVSILVALDLVSWMDLSIQLLYWPSPWAAI